MSVAKFQNHEMMTMRLFGFFTLILLVATFAIWGSVARLSGAIIATGGLEVAGYKQIVQHETGGRVKTITVQNGAKVAQNDILMTLDGAQIRPEFEIYNRLYIESLAEKGRLIAERDDLAAPQFPSELIDLVAGNAELEMILEQQSNLFDYRKQAVENEIQLLNEQAGQINQRIAGVRAQIISAETQISLLEDELARNRRLVTRGLVGKGAVSNLERELAGLEGNLGRLTTDIAAFEDELSRTEIEKLKLVSKPREEAIARLRELETREVESMQRRNELAEEIAKLELRAPIAGVVYGLQVFKPETVIGAGDPLLYIVPSDDEVLVRGQIEAQDITDVYIGQDVELKFSAFNLRKMPYIGGTVENVSADAFVDEQTGRRYYEVEVRPEDGALDKLGADTLTPGQPVELFLHTQSRTFWDYLMTPLADNFDRAFREN